ncbi:hypothetical protein DERP_015080 [Dermatophagoides pteronyssinus]|uniref:Uncharacterized protein n=1 Tax=Dermatophagoides pteronyssinus TaxID=6956 RepID=A0ABQ8JRC5_DERPT|nr:hypothetical protein DERP_015080 [Dermatophagoides pteronyssinus]
MAPSTVKNSMKTKKSESEIYRSKTKTNQQQQNKPFIQDVFMKQNKKIVADFVAVTFLIGLECKPNNVTSASNNVISCDDPRKRSLNSKSLIRTLTLAPRQYDLVKKKIFTLHFVSDDDKRPKI